MHNRFAGRLSPEPSFPAPVLDVTSFACGARYVEQETKKRYRLIPERMMTAPGARPQALIMAEPIRALDSVELLRTAGLSEREAEVAMVTLRGFKSGDGAEALRMSEHTFLSHLKSVYRKLGVGSRGELASLILSGM